MKHLTLCVVFFTALFFCQYSYSQNGSYNFLVPKSFLASTQNCQTQFNRFPNPGNLISNYGAANIVELGQLYHLSTYWYAPIPQDSNPRIDTVGIILQKIGTTGNSILRAKIYAADSSGATTLLATSADVNTQDVQDTVSVVYFPFASPVRVPDWVMLSIEMTQQPGDTIAVLSSSGECIEHPFSSFVLPSGSTTFQPFQTWYSVNDSGNIVPAIADLGIMALMANRIVPPSTSKCADYFVIYPDSVTNHLWHIYNFTRGQQPVTLTINWGDGTSSNAIDTISHTYAASGYYNICITMVDDSGCSSTFCDSSFYINRMDGSNQMVTVTVSSSNTTTTGVKNIEPTVQQMTVSPNPCSTCEIKGVNSEKNLVLTDMLGRKINVTLNKTAGGLLLNLPKGAGMYLLKNIRTGEVVKVAGM